MWIMQVYLFAIVLINRFHCICAYIISSQSYCTVYNIYTLYLVYSLLWDDLVWQALSHHMDEANNLLQQILQGYVDFHTMMKEKSSLHPSSVQEELLNYDATLCQYFGVSRDPPVQKVCYSAWYYNVHNLPLQKPKRQIKGITDQSWCPCTVY